MRIGLVGYGDGGRYFHAPFINGVAGCELVGVVTRSAQRRAELAADLPGVPAYDSLKALAEAGVDGVVISTPAETRSALVLEAIELGIAVVGDKPFGMDTAQALALVDAARERDVLLSVYQNRRWDSDMLTLRKLIESGRLGPVRRFESGFERYQPEQGLSCSGGNILRDYGSHLVDQALLLFGPVNQVYAELDRYSDQPSAHSGFFMALTHANGVVSHLRGSCKQSSPGPRMRVTGEFATFSVDAPDGQAEALFAGRTPKAEKDRWGVADHRQWGWLAQGDARERIPSEPGNWTEFYRQWLAALQGRGPVPVDPMDAVLTARVLDAAQLSADQQRVVKLVEIEAARPSLERKIRPNPKMEINSKNC